MRRRGVRAKGEGSAPFQTEGARYALHDDLLFQVANPNLQFDRYFSTIGFAYSRAHLPPLMAVSVHSKSDFAVAAVSAQPLIHNADVAVLLGDFVLVDDNFSRQIMAHTLPH